MNWLKRIWSLRVILFLFVGWDVNSFAQISLVNVGQFSNGAQSIRVVASGNYLYLANHSDGLRIFDITNPKSLTNICHINPNLGGAFFSVAVAGTNAFIADPNYGLLIYNISNPTNPVISSQTKDTNVFGAFTYCVAVSGNYAYAANYNDGVLIYDVSNPTNPINVGHITNAPPSRLVSQVAISGHYAYLAGEGYGLKTYDVTDPTNPTFVSKIFTNGTIRNLEVLNNRLYAASGYNGLQIYSISNSSGPNLIGYATNGFFAEGVTVSGGFAYLANGYDGLRVYDISNPITPIDVGHVKEGVDPAWHVAVANNHVYLANDIGGLRDYAMNPELSLSRTISNSFVFSWLATAPFALQQNADLTTANWDTLTNSATTFGASNQIMLPNFDSKMFFRLISQISQ